MDCSPLAGHIRGKFAVQPDNKGQIKIETDESLVGGTIAGVAQMIMLSSTRPEYVERKSSTMPHPRGPKRLY